MVTLEVAIKNNSGIVMFDSGLCVSLSGLQNFELI